MFNTRFNIDLKSNLMISKKITHNPPQQKYGYKDTHTRGNVGEMGWKMMVTNKFDFYILTAAAAIGNKSKRSRKISN